MNMQKEKLIVKYTDDLGNKYKFTVILNYNNDVYSQVHNLIKEKFFTLRHFVNIDELFNNNTGGLFEVLDAIEEESINTNDFGFTYETVKCN